MLKNALLAGAVVATLAFPALARPRYHYVPYHAPLYYQHHYSLGSPVDVVFTNLNDGATVGQSFVVSGYTSPGNVVDVTVTSPFFGQHTNTVRADGGGNFHSNVDNTVVPLGGQVTVTMQARGGPARSINVVRTQ